jgi:hypothetical protein
MLKTTLAAFVLIATALPTLADMRVTATYGNWISSEGVDNDNTLMCNAGLIGADRAFFVKSYSDFFFVHMVKEGWQITPDQSVEVTLQVDNAPPMNFVGFGLSAEAHQVYGGFLIPIKPDEVWEHTGIKTITELVNLLKNGRKFRLSFPDGDEPAWEGSSAGSGKALTGMMDCQRRLVIAARPTQPFGAKKTSPAQALGPAPPQPFGVVPPALPQAVEMESSEGASKRRP